MGSHTIHDTSKIRFVQPNTLVGSNNPTLGPAEDLTVPNVLSLLNVYTVSQVDTALASKSNVGHTHAAGDISGLLAFGSIIVAGQTTVVANNSSSPLTFIAGSNVTIETNATGDTITFNSTAAGGGGGTVTHTAGPLVLDRIVLGAGGSDTKTAVGFDIVLSPGIVHTLNIGDATTSGALQLFNSVGDSSFLFAFNGVTTSNVFLPPAGQIATLAGAETFTNKTLEDPIINVAGTDAPGDIYYRNAGGLFTRLGIGSDTHILTVTAGLPVWAAPSGGGGNSFGTIVISGQSSVVADTANDSLTLVAGSGITLATNATTDTITITASGGGGNVSKVGTPVDNQVGVWTGDGLIEGTSGLTFNAGVLTCTTVSANLTGNVTGNVSGSSGSCTGNSATVTTNADLTGPVTSVGNATTITDNAVTLAKMADVATGTVFYRKTAATGDPEVQTLATLKTDLGLTGTNSGDSLAFGTVVVSGQSNVVADLASDTLTLVAGTNITITTNAATDTITISATGGGGSGTVTATGGALTANSIVLGAGTVDTKVLAGFTTDGLGQVNLGTTGTNAGRVKFNGLVTGDVTLTGPSSPTGGSLVTLPGATSTLATLALTETLTNKTLTSAVLTNTVVQDEEPTNTPSGTTQTILLANGNHQTLALTSATGTVTATLTVPSFSSAGTIIVKQHASATKDITWAVSAGTIKWMGEQPVWASDAVGSVRIVSWRYDGSVMYLAATEAGI